MEVVAVGRGLKPMTSPVRMEIESIILLFHAPLTLCSPASASPSPNPTGSQRAWKPNDLAVHTG